MVNLMKFEPVNKDFYPTTTESSLGAKKMLYNTFDYESYKKVFPQKPTLTRAQKRKIITKLKKKYGMSYMVFSTTGKK